MAQMKISIFLAQMKDCIFQKLAQMQYVTVFHIVDKESKNCSFF
jgi:hypothetical protein